MPRKNSKIAKSFTTEKHFTTVPPKAKPAEVKPAAITPAVATVVAGAQTPVIAAEVKSPVVADLKPLLAALHDLDADVACEAATALGNSGNAAAVQSLIEIVQNTDGFFHSVVRSAAAAGLATLKDKKSVEALINAVNDPITDSSTEAIRALAALGDNRAVPTLIQVVKNETGFYAGSVRRAAVLALVQIGGEAAKVTLQEVAANPQEDTVIREEAKNATAAK